MVLDPPKESESGTQQLAQVVLELSKTDPTKKRKHADYMNAYTFYYWLLLFQKHVVLKDPNQQVLLIVDNASCHERLQLLPRPRVIFLTSRLHTCPRTQHQSLSPSMQA